MVTLLQIIPSSDDPIMDHTPDCFPFYRQPDLMPMVYEQSWYS